MTLPIKLPDLNLLNKLFEYCDGKLIRKVSTGPRGMKGQEAGYMSGGGYLQVQIDGTIYKVHRVIWKICHGRDPGPCLDHFDGNKTNNRIENLREVDKSHNNRRSGNIGNVERRPSGRHRGSVSVNGKKFYSGTHDTCEQAQQAIYDFCDRNGVRYD